MFIFAYKNVKISKQKSVSGICSPSPGIWEQEGPWKLGVHQVKWQVQVQWEILFQILVRVESHIGWYLTSIFGFHILIHMWVYVIVLHFDIIGQWFVFYISHLHTPKTTWRVDSTTPSEIITTLWKWLLKFYSLGWRWSKQSLEWVGTSLSGKVLATQLWGAEFMLLSSTKEVNHSGIFNPSIGTWRQEGPRGSWGSSDLAKMAMVESCRGWHLTLTAGLHIHTQGKTPCRSDKYFNPLILLPLILFLDEPRMNCRIFSGSQDLPQNNKKI